MSNANRWAILTRDVGSNTTGRALRLICWAGATACVLLVGLLWCLNTRLKPEKRNNSFRLVDKKTLSSGVKVWFYVPSGHILGDDFIARVSLRNSSQEQLRGQVSMGACGVRYRFGDGDRISSNGRQVVLGPEAFLVFDHVITEREYLPFLKTHLGILIIPSVSFEGYDDNKFISFNGSTGFGNFPCDITVPTSVEGGDIFPIKVCFLNTLSCNLTNTTLYFELPFDMEAVSGDKEVKIGTVHTGERVTVEREFRALKSREGTIHVSIEAKELWRNRLKSLDILVN